MINGTVIDNMVIGGPAYNSQLLGRGDTILKVDGISVTNENILESMVGCDVPGSIMDLCIAKAKVRRFGKGIELWALG